MSAFEKWEDEKWQEIGCGPLEPCGSCKVLREEGWRAALTEVDFLGYDLVAIKAFIHKELED